MRDEKGNVGLSLSVKNSAGEYMHMTFPTTAKMWAGAKRIVRARAVGRLDTTLREIQEELEQVIHA